MIRYFDDVDITLMLRYCIRDMCYALRCYHIMPPYDTPRVTTPLMLPLPCAMRYVLMLMPLMP